MGFAARLGIPNSEAPVSIEKTSGSKKNILGGLLSMFKDIFSSDAGSAPRQSDKMKRGIHYRLDNGGIVKPLEGSRRTAHNASEASQASTEKDDESIKKFSRRAKKHEQDLAFLRMSQMEKGGRSGNGG